MKTLLLDTRDWDLLLDASGNIALAAEPYAVAQDVASAVRLFEGELWYDTRKGVPYFREILGQLPPESLIQQRFTAAALTVPGVIAANVAIGTLDNSRVLTGQIQITDEKGQTQYVSIN